MKYCKNCGKELPDGIQFCTNCGAKQEEAGFQPPAPPKKKNGLIIGIIAAVVIAVIVAAVILILNRNSEGEKNSESGSVITDEIKEAETGDCIEFGEYEQDGDKENGKEPIEWLVLDKEDDRILVISKYALDCQPYNEEYEDITWEDCTLREWLNDDFIDEAFSEDEAEVIPAVKVTADENPEYDTDPGNDTKDKVFLLSIDEANKYFDSDKERECEPTEYAVDSGAYVNSDNGNCWWWLRSPGDYQYYAAYVNYGGDVYEYGYYVYSDYDAVRPALWIDLNS